jgi:hypothetical protein
MAEAMTRDVDNLTEALARELARAEGVNPDSVDSDGVVRWRWYLRDVDALQRAVAAAQSVIVPLTPTPEMLTASDPVLRGIMPSFVALPSLWADGQATASRLWRAMTEAAGGARS